MIVFWRQPLGALIVVMSLFGSVAGANDFISWDDEIGSEDEVPATPPAKPAAHAKPEAVTPPTKPIATTPAAPKPAPAARPAPEPVATAEPARTPDPAPTRATSRPPPAPMPTPAPAPAPAPVAPVASPTTTVKRPWSTKFKCAQRQFATRIDDVGDLIDHSLHFNDVYGKQLVSPDRLTSFQLAQDPSGGLQVVLDVTRQTMLGNVHVRFDAPALICEDQPGSLVAIIQAEERRDCVPLQTCQAIASYMNKQYRVNIRAQSSNSVGISGEDMTPGIYVGAPGASQ